MRKIYLVAGSRNMAPGAVTLDNKGLIANVGKTDRSVEERLRDPDYARKAAGGDWRIIKTWQVPDTISDTDVGIGVKILNPLLTLKPNSGIVSAGFDKWRTKWILVKES